VSRGRAALTALSADEPPLAAGGSGRTAQPSSANTAPVLAAITQAFENVSV
jgi:hypothetical protein